MDLSLIKGIFFILFTLASTLVLGKTVSTLSHQVKAPAVDGVINEAEWQKATKIDVNYQTAPAKGQLAPGKTQAYEFYVNPVGVQIDTRMKENSFWAVNESWDVTWSSAVEYWISDL